MDDETMSLLMAELTKVGAKHAHQKKLQEHMNARRGRGGTDTATATATPDATGTAHRLTTMRGGNKKFDAFLSHHKKRAAMEARLLSATAELLSDPRSLPFAPCLVARLFPSSISSSLLYHSLQPAQTYPPAFIPFVLRCPPWSGPIHQRQARHPDGSARKSLPRLRRPQRPQSSPRSCSRDGSPRAIPNRRRPDSSIVSEPHQPKQ